MLASKMDALQIVAVSAIILSLSILLFYFISKWLYSQKTSTNKTAPTSITIQKPFIFPGKITHVRLIPTFHSSLYSYLMVGIPIIKEPQGNLFLSVDKLGWWKRGWLSVEARDHLGRGNNDKGIRHKFELYLESEELDPAKYPNVYLVTAPRILNYTFSPASFWFLYSSNFELQAMVAEVNNTFDERRMYFLPSSQGEIEYENPEQKPLGPTRQRPFQYKWPKDMHVSPFSSRKGMYALSAKDPSLPAPRSLAAVTSGNIIDIKATLLSSKGSPKLVAHLWSSGKPLDPAAISYLQFFRFMLSWWWVGIMTYPRILTQAVKLAYVKNLSIWYKPEPRATGVSRHANPEEIIFESVFQKYLSHLVTKSSQYKSPCSLVYTSITNKVHQVTLNNSNVPSDHSLDLHILTPAFYSRLVCHQTLNLALSAEILHPIEENRTATSSDPSSLYAFLSPSLDVPTTKTKSESIPTRIAWALIDSLREMPEEGLYPNPAIPHFRTKQYSQIVKPPQRQAPKVRSPGSHHFLDAFVRQFCDESEQRDYRHAVLRLFLARRIAMGDVYLLWVLRLFVRMVSCALVAWLGTGSRWSRAAVFGVTWQIWGWLESLFL